MYPSRWDRCTHPGLQFTLLDTFPFSCWLSATGLPPRPIFNDHVLYSFSYPSATQRLQMTLCTQLQELYCQGSSEHLLRGVAPTYTLVCAPPPPRTHIDECNPADPDAPPVCGPHSTCTNTDSSYTCSCANGYKPAPDTGLRRLLGDTAPGCVGEACVAKTDSVQGHPAVHWLTLWSVQACIGMLQLVLGKL